MHSSFLLNHRSSSTPLATPTAKPAVKPSHTADDRPKFNDTLRQQSTPKHEDQAAEARDERSPHAKPAVEADAEAGKDTAATVKPVDATGLTPQPVVMTLDPQANVPQSLTPVTPEALPSAVALSADHPLPVTPTAAPVETPAGPLAAMQPMTADPAPAAPVAPAGDAPAAMTPTSVAAPTAAPVEAGQAIPAATVDNVAQGPSTLTANQPATTRAATPTTPQQTTEVAAMQPATVKLDPVKAPGNVDAPTLSTVASVQSSETQAAPVVSKLATSAMPTPPSDDGGAMGDLNAASVKRGVMTSQSSNGQTVTVRLDPPSLGSVRIQVRMSGGETNASIGTSSDVAHSLVRGSLDQLKAGLERSGITVDRINVTRMAPAGAAEAPTDARGGDQPGGQNDGRSGGREQADQQQRDQARREAILRQWRQAA